MVGAGVEPGHLLRHHADAAGAAGRRRRATGNHRPVHRLRLGSARVQAEFKEYTFNLLYELYENEVAYTHSLYDGVSWSEDVI